MDADTIAIPAAVIHWDDIRFSAIAIVRSHHVEFEVFDMEGIGEKRCWHKKESPSHPDPVESLEEAEIYLSGSVKWDGCSDWHFDEQDRVCIHGCCRTDLSRLGEVLGRCWDWTKDHLPSWFH